jgi:hypothetical protein
MVQLLVAVPAVGFAKSVTLPVKVVDPGPAVGVPVIAPVFALRLRPAGSAGVVTMEKV